MSQLNAMREAGSRSQVLCVVSQNCPVLSAPLVIFTDLFVCSRPCRSLTRELQRAFELVPREMLADGGFGSCCITELSPHHLNTQSKHTVGSQL